MTDVSESSEFYTHTKKRPRKSYSHIFLKEVPDCAPETGLAEENKQQKEVVPTTVSDRSTDRKSSAFELDTQDEPANRYTSRYRFWLDFDSSGWFLRRGAGGSPRDRCHLLPNRNGHTENFQQRGSQCER
jgi:hypothetical protein